MLPDSLLLPFFGGESLGPRLGEGGGGGGGEDKVRAHVHEVELTFHRYIVHNDIQEECGSTCSRLQL